MDRKIGPKSWATLETLQSKLNASELLQLRLHYLEEDGDNFVDYINQKLREKYGQEGFTTLYQFDAEKDAKALRFFFKEYFDSDWQKAQASVDILSKLAQAAQAAQAANEELLQARKARQQNSQAQINIDSYREFENLKSLAQACDKTIVGSIGLKLFGSGDASYEKSKEDLVDAMNKLAQKYNIATVYHQDDVSGIVGVLQPCNESDQSNEKSSLLGTVKSKLQGQFYNRRETQFPQLFGLKYALMAITFALLVAFIPFSFTALSFAIGIATSIGKFGYFLGEKYLGNSVIGTDTETRLVMSEPEPEKPTKTEVGVPTSKLQGSYEGMQQALPPGPAAASSVHDHGVDDEPVSSASPSSSPSLHLVPQQASSPSSGRFGSELEEKDEGQPHLGD